MCGPCSDGTYWSDLQEKKEAPYDPDFDGYNHICSGCGESLVYCRCSVRRSQSVESDAPC